MAEATTRQRVVEPEAVIRQRLAELVEGIRMKDIDTVMSLYAPDLVSFDFGPPLQYAGPDNKRRAWEEVFTAYTGPLAYEVRDSSVTTHGDLALVHSVNHVSGALANGHVTDVWVRCTVCFRRINGTWLIVHDHLSVPTDLGSGRALLNLTP